MEECKMNTNLTLRTTEMFGEVQTDIYESDNNDMYMTARQLGECLGYADPQKGINTLLVRNKHLKSEHFSVVTKVTAKDGKKHNMRLFNKYGICEIISLSESNISLERKRELIQKICPEFVSTQTRKEIEFEEKAKRFLAPLHLTGKTQYGVPPYRIDFYIPEIKLAVEYDENEHKNYNKEKEKERESYLKDTLGCEIVRLSDKNSDEYNLGIIAKAIFNSARFKYADRFNHCEENLFEDELSGLPNINVEKPDAGFWKPIIKNKQVIGYKCSECGYEISLDHKTKYYCDRCLVEMPNEMEYGDE